jgi:hypothetical protein
MGGTITTDESKPCPEGHYLARSKISWLVTVYFIWLLVQAVLSAVYLTDALTTTPLLLPIWLIFTIVVGAFLFVFNILYWAPTRKSRKTTDFSKCPKEPSELTKLDRLFRAANDQWLVSVVLGCSIFIGIFMIVFYQREGVSTFAPLSVAPTGLEISNYIIMKLFEAALLFISAAAFIIAMCTESDTLQRIALKGGMVKADVVEDKTMIENTYYGSNLL